MSVRPFGRLPPRPRAPLNGGRATEGVDLHFVSIFGAFVLLHFFFFVGGGFLPCIFGCVVSSCTYLIKFCRLKLLHANLSIYQLCRFCFTFLHYFRLQLTRYFNGYLVAKSDFFKDLAKFSVWCGRVGPFFYLIPDVFSFLSFFWA